MRILMTHVQYKDKSVTCRTEYSKETWSYCSDGKEYQGESLLGLANKVYENTIPCLDGTLKGVDISLNHYGTKTLIVEREGATQQEILTDLAKLGFSIQRMEFSCAR